jgi:ATP-binding protein involved in chromosome partitioning
MNIMSDKFGGIRRLLTGIIHPESGRNIVEAEILGDIGEAGGILSVTLDFQKARDPFANSIRRQVKEAIETAYPDMCEKIVVHIREAAPKRKAEEIRPKTTTGDIKKVLAVSSAKGGVGKSTVTANLAVTLACMGYSVGVLDADIYGPSQPKMFGVEGYQPPVDNSSGSDMIMPAEAHGVKIMSIGFFIGETDALVWRGPMATSALRQMIHQTAWGELDFLLIDLPPGTGDVHLTILAELAVSATVIVTTPQQIALADVARGIRMFRSQGVEVSIIGMIENMAWFTPAELPDNRYYIFGRGGAEALAKRENLPILGKIPIIQSVMEGGEKGTPGVELSEAIAGYYHDIAKKVVDNLK